MRRRILIGLGLLALLAAGFGLGMVAQWQLQLGVEGAKARIAENMIRQFVPDEGPVPPAPPLEEWQYPGATSKGGITGPSLAVMGKPVLTAARYETWLTPDDYGKVLEFYAKKAHVETKEPISPFDQWTQGKLSPREINYLLSDNYSNAADPLKARPVRAQCLIRRCGSYNLTVFVTRAEGEKFTHVVLLYEPSAGGQAELK